MKVSLDLKNDKVNKAKEPVAFKGYKPTLSEDGFKNYEFSYVFDENKDDCYLEIFKLGHDRNGNYFTNGLAYNSDGSTSYKLTSGQNRIDLAQTFGIDDNTPFAYHYVLVDKNSKHADIRIDSGESIDFRKNNNDDYSIFNIVLPTKSNLSRGGSMKLVIVDSQNVGKVYNDKNMIVEDSNLIKRALKGIKTITNKYGGTLAGLEEDVEKGKYDMYNRIISLPLFTDDDFSAHAYWNKNCMQMASSLGNINNYASLQRKMFAHGLNFVSDGAFVNEGLQGVHFKNMLYWGEESPYFNWFKASGLKDSPLSMGVFTKNKKYISHKIVNSPYTYEQKDNGKVVVRKNNKNYDPKKPTYIQFFDSRLVTDEERNDTTSLIKTYSKMSTDNVYKIHTHNDSVFPYSFEINPETYNRNIKLLNEYNDSLGANDIINLSGPMAARILSKFDNFVVDGKFESGFETWDANPDIAKLNFVYSHADTKFFKNIDPSHREREVQKFKRANYQVQDYAVTSGQYWTQKTDDILRLSVAQKLKHLDKQNPSLIYDTILNHSDGKSFPKSLKSEITRLEVSNVLSGYYNNKRTLSNEDKKSQILEGLMNTPLDSFEFGDNIVGVLASPYISKRAMTKDEIGVSRYELYKKENRELPAEFKKTYQMMNELYKNEMSDFAVKVLSAAETKLVEDYHGEKLFDGDKVTEYGKYVLPLIMPEIAKYAVVHGLAPDVEISVNNQSGEISYDYNALKETYLQGLGITNPSSPRDEAEMLLGKMRNGIKRLSVSEDSKIVDSIVKTLKGTNVESFKLADLIINKTQAGLDWRIDATKDIADIESVRSKNNSFEYTWQKIIDFWKAFNQGVISKNPNAYTVAEITDEGQIYMAGHGERSAKFSSASDIVAKFQRETGMTSTANYSYFFNDLPEIFSKKFEDGNSVGNDDGQRQWKLYKILDGYLRSASLDSLMYSYTFIGNHDKPRALHCMAMDMTLFYTNLNDFNNKKYRMMAYKLIHDKFDDNNPVPEWKVDNYDFSAVSPKAVAMGYALRSAFIKVLNDRRQNMSNEDFNYAFESISKSVSDLTQGKFEGKRFNPDAFGIKPFDVSISMVLKNARDKYGLPASLGKDYEDAVFEKALTPAMQKLQGMMEYLVALPGMPTLFDGDDMGATGYETKTKNMFLQNRQRVHNEWAEEENPKYKEFIFKNKEKFDKIMKVRRDPKCNALNNGAPFILPPQHSESGVTCPAVLRQSTDGRMAISIFNTSALHDNYEGEYHPQTQTFEAINLNFEVQKRDDKQHIEFMTGKDAGRGIAGLKHDTIFVNANDPNDLYYVNEYDGKYFLKHGSGDGKIRVDGSTLILYHVPEGTPLSFTGRVDINIPANIVTDAYSNKTIDSGKKLALYK